MYSNTSENSGMMIGRVARINTFGNANGSQNVLLTIAVRRNKETTDFLSCKGYCAPGKLGPYPYISVGDKIQVSYSLRAESYEGKDGQTVYQQVCRINQINFLETREVREQHRAQHMAEQQADRTEQPKAKNRRSA